MIVLDKGVAIAVCSCIADGADRPVEWFRARQALVFYDEADAELARTCWICVCRPCAERHGFVAGQLAPVCFDAKSELELSFLESPYEIDDGEPSRVAGERMDG